MRGRAAPNHHGHLARIHVELFAFTHCSAECVELSHKHLPVFEAEGFADDITALVKGRNKDVAEMAKKGDEKTERRSGEKKVSSFQSLEMARNERAR